MTDEETKIMADNESRVMAILEQILDSDCTPDEACRDCPDLLAIVRERLSRFRSVEAEVAVAFPPRNKPGVPSRALLGGPAGALPNLAGYDVEEIVGSGGMGVVYRARHRELNRIVAIKLLLAGGYAAPYALERFKREAQALAAIRHPNIVQVFDGGEHDGFRYLTMEFMDGGRLSDKLAGTPQPARHAAEVVSTLAHAVHALHEHGIVHRDLKPSNVLLTADGTLKIADFGLAHRRDGNEATFTREGTPIGTPSYMSPEQALGKSKELGPAVDIYALGAILYEMLTGRPPFRGETSVETQRLVIADEPVPPSRLNPKVPRNLETVCLKCLEKDPKRRYASAMDLAEDLRRFGRGEPVAARRASAIEKAIMWARRRPAAAALLAAGVLMFAGVTSATVWFADHRARLHSEEASRAATVNGEANTALGLAESHLQILRDRLNHPFEVRELLSDINQWGAALDQARQDWQRAKSASAGNEALVAKDTRARIHAIEAALSDEDAGYRLARELDDILAEAYTPVESRRWSLRSAKTKYSTFFLRLGVDIDQADKVHLGSVITSSPIRFALVAGLDNWADVIGLLEPKDPQLALLLELARAADPDPWRDRFRNPAVWGDRTALTALAQDVDVEQQSPTILASLGRRLRVAGADSTPVYKHAILCHQRDFWLHLNAAFDSKDPGLKLGLCLSALANRPGSTVGYNYLSSCLRTQGDWREAMTAARTALAIDSRSVPSYNVLGLALRDGKDLPGAVAAFSKAIELDPQYVPAYLNLGIALRESKDLSGAVAAFKKATELAPQFPPAHFNLGIALRDSKDLVGAVAANKKAIELDPQFTPAYINLGLALRDNKDLPGAVAAFKKATELDPTNATAHSDLGLALRESKDLPGAVAAYKTATELDPKSAVAQEDLGLALRDSKDLAGAVAAFQKAIELDPGEYLAHHTLGTTLLLQRRYAEAEEAFLGAVRTQSDFVPSYNSLARLLAACPDDKVRDGKRAIEYARKACEQTGWKVSRYLDTLAAGYAEAGQFEEAVRYQTRALEDTELKGELRTATEQRLELYRQQKPFRDQGP